MAPRYSVVGDEYLTVELAEAMSLEANLRVMAVTGALREQSVAGVEEICPANVSFMLRFDPNAIAAEELIAVLRDLEQRHFSLADWQLATRVIEIPVLYGDEWTHEVVMRFRDHHQDPSVTDLEYSARINGYASVEEFVMAHHSAPYFISMTGFVPGAAWYFQIVPEGRQIQVPKYPRPRTDTPERAVGHGGAFGAVYPVRGAGGYQLFGRTPVPLLDTSQRLGDFRESMTLLRPADIVKFRPIERDEYDAIRGEVDSGVFRHRIVDVTLGAEDFFSDPGDSTTALLGGRA